jgi:hypothetical protein
MASLNNTEDEIYYTIAAFPRGGQERAYFAVAIGEQDNAQIQNLGDMAVVVSVRELAGFTKTPLFEEHSSS